VTDAEAEDPSRIFKFNAGGAGMGREEMMRLLSAGKIWAHNPALRVTVEGFGDFPGADTLTVGIAKHRAKVGQTLLTKAGIPEDRITLTFSDTGPDPRLARSIRITTYIEEVERP
jgi:outer membrane protein OmpA-like peptidoglycan-associated protein